MSSKAFVGSGRKTPQGLEMFGGDGWVGLRLQVATALASCE